MLLSRHTRRRKFIAGLTSAMAFDPSAVGGWARAILDLGSIRNGCRVIVAEGRGELDDAVVGTANDLLIRCNAAAHLGADFPAVWKSILRGHPLVVGSPVQTVTDDMRSHLEIRLINGQRLIYDCAAKQYSVSWAPRRRPF